MSSTSSWCVSCQMGFAFTLSPQHAFGPVLSHTFTRVLPVNSCLLLLSRCCSSLLSLPPSFSSLLSASKSFSSLLSVPQSFSSLLSAPQSFSSLLSVPESFRSLLSLSQSFRSLLSLLQSFSSLLSLPQSFTRFLSPPQSSTSSLSALAATSPLPLPPRTAWRVSVAEGEFRPPGRPEDIVTDSYNGHTAVVVRRADG